MYGKQIVVGLCLLFTASLSSGSPVVLCTATCALLTAGTARWDVIMATDNTEKGAFEKLVAKCPEPSGGTISTGVYFWTDSSGQIHTEASHEATAKNSCVTVRN